MRKLLHLVLCCLVALPLMAQGIGGKAGIGGKDGLGGGLATNLLVSPNDITNAAWANAGTGCVKTNATTYTSAGNACTLDQTFTTTTNTNYTVQVTVAFSGATPGTQALSLANTSFAAQCSSSTASHIFFVVLNCTASSGANTTMQIELDLGNSNSGANTVLNWWAHK